MSSVQRVSRLVSCAPTLVYKGPRLIECQVYTAVIDTHLEVLAIAVHINSQLLQVLDSLVERFCHSFELIVVYPPRVRAVIL